jgi:signal transduction histidine kinase
VIADRKGFASVDTTVLVALLIRLLVVGLAVAGLQVRTTLAPSLIRSYALASGPLLLLNGIALVFFRRLSAALQRRSALLYLDLAIAVALLQLGGGWRSSYFGYTLTTIVLFTVVDRKRGAAISAGTLALAALVKDPSGAAPSLETFFATSWDLRLGAAEFYVLAGVTIGHFKTLVDRVQALSEAAVEEARRRSAMEEKARVALDLHDGAKQMANAMLLRMHPLVKKLQSGHGETAEEVRWLWVGMNYLKAELDQVMDALKAGDGDARHACDLVEIVEGEVRMAAVMTGFSWSVSAEPATIRVALHSDLALRRFVGEALMNAWKHSGERSGKVRLEAADESVVITVADSGKGFCHAGASGAPTSGLRSLRHRAHELGAELAMETEPGQGCRVILTIPTSCLRASQR